MEGGAHAGLQSVSLTAHTMQIMPRRKEWSAHLSPVAVVPLPCHEGTAAYVSPSSGTRCAAPRRAGKGVRHLCQVAALQAALSLQRGCARLEGDGGGNLGGGAQQTYDARPCA